MNKIGYFFLIIAVVFTACDTLNIISDNDALGVLPYQVVFTFDDGPNNHHTTTARLLDVLNKYDIKGVFCLIGINVLQYPDIVRRMYNEGHTIVNHGYSDSLAYFLSEKEFRENLLKGERAISEVLGKDLFPKLYRPQGGIYKKSHERIFTEEGYTLVPFTISVMDAYTAPGSSKDIIKKVINKTVESNGGIILLHDGRDTYERTEIELQRKPHGDFNRSWIPAAVEEIIISLLDKGYKLNEPFNFR